MIEIERALQTLGYHPNWLAYELVDEAFLREQLAKYREGDDPNTEHYRYGAFRRILAKRTALDEATLARYVELAQIDPDTTMGEAAFIDLLWWKGTTAAQLDWLEKHDPFHTRAVRNVFEHVRRRIGA